MGEHRVSFLILTRNRRDSVVRTVKNVIGQRYTDKEIIVVDNGSTDGTADFLRSQFPQIKVIETGSNLGSCAGRNRGIRAATGEYLIFLDDDCLLAGEETAESVVSNFVSDPSCGAIAFNILDPLAERSPYDVSGLENRASEVMIFCAGGFAARRKALVDVGGFWEDLFMVQVDTELSMRVVNAGWRIISRGDIVVYHPTPVGGEPFSVKREIYFRARNAVWVGLRDLPISLWPSFVLRKHWQSLAFAIRLGQLPLYFRALLDALRLVPRCIMLRRPLKREYIHRARAHSLKMWI